MLSPFHSPKVIPLYGNYCTYVCGPFSYPLKMPLVVSQNEMPSQIIKKLPVSHHHVDVGEHSVLGGVPEGIPELGVALDGHVVDGTPPFKAALFELKMTF